MQIAVVSATAEDEAYFRERLAGHDLRFHPGAADDDWAADPGNAGTECLCVFVHDRVTPRAVAALPRLRLIATRSTGFDHVAVSAAAQEGVTVCNVPSYGENTVAEYTFALILALARNLHLSYLRGKSGDFRPEGTQGFDLKEKTVGIVGMGRIGLHVARIARGFHMTILAADPYPNRVYAELLDFSYVPLEELLARSDIVTLHAPLTDSTRHLLDADAVAKMKPGALLVNTSRGGLVDTAAVLAALDSGRLCGAGLDVLENEDRLADIGESLVRDRPNLILTPHVAYNTREAVRRIRETTADNIEAFLAGRPQNVVVTGG
ncbi:MAG TPA: NAD(P)-dependent oxidoreductase [Armatimonadaceae bacterium]|nr:NAD(P)-dependent oxidoreductase [Armatimonadaceae bacterium]